MPFWISDIWESHKEGEISLHISRIHQPSRKREEMHKQAAIEGLLHLGVNNVTVILF